MKPQFVLPLDLDLKAYFNEDPPTVQHQQHLACLMQLVRNTAPAKAAAAPAAATPAPVVAPAANASTTPAAIAT